jgi:nanoRNase/pAp phosphatase (c-di-AMP/oligoRNAs hydrolase)
MNTEYHSESQLTNVLNIIRGFKTILILTHGNPDPDAIAGAFALKYLISRRTKCKARVVYSGVIGRRENRTMIKELSLKMVSVDEIKWKEYDGLILVDHQPRRRFYTWPANRWPDIIIDHHPRRPLEKPVKLIDVRTEFGSSSSLVASYLFATGLPIPRWLSTALVYGIVTDTQEFSRGRIEADKKTFVTLFENVYHQKLYRISHPMHDCHSLTNYWHAIKSAIIWNDTVESFMGLISAPDNPAEIADNLINIQGMRFALVSGFYDKSLFMSLRIRNARRDAGGILRKIVGRKGSAGGHGFMAGAQIRNLDSLQDARQLAGKLHQKFVQLLHPDIREEQAKPVLPKE